MVEFVGLVALLVVVIGVVFAAATPVGRDISAELLCVVQSSFEDGPAECSPGSGGEDGAEDEGGPGGGDPGEGDPGDSYSPPSGDCEQDVTFDKTNLDEEYSTHVVEIGCVWYWVPTICASGDLPEGWFDREDDERVYLGDEIQEFVDCVTDGFGEPSDDPDSEDCVNTAPTSEEIDEDVPNVQVGCKDLPVPVGCEAEWEAYRDALPGADRAGEQRELRECVEEAYDSMEPDCFIEVTGHVDQTNVKFLFFRFGDSQGSLIEQLGDGRVRIHILDGVEMGAGLSGDGVGGSPISFDVAGITGYTNDTTYEFTSMEDAQEWVDWYEEYDSVRNSTGQENCSGYTRGPQYCPGVEDRSDRLAELADEEPEHHVAGSASVDVKKVKLSGGLTFEKEAGPVNIEGSVEGGYEGEIQIESRNWSDGSYEVAYQSSDIGAFLIGAGLSGDKPFTKDKKKNEKSDDDEPGAGGGVGGSKSVEWKGTTRTTVIWGPDGELAQMYITMDDQVLQTLKDAGVDLEATLPYGFTAGGGYNKSEQEGTATVKELIIDFNQYPELRDSLGPKIDEVFPGGKDGALKKDDVEMDGNDSDGGGIYEVAEEYGNVRELEYDTSKTTEGGNTNISWEGLDLLDVEWASVDEERTLNESSLEVTDVNGDKQIVDPAPRCKHKKFEADDGYYTTDFSAPGTEFDLYDNDSPRFTDGTYPGTDYDGDVPGDNDDLTESLVDEYSAAYPDKNILVVKDFENFDFNFVGGFDHLATVDGMDVIALDGGTVKNNGDGGYNNWRFRGQFDYDSDEKVVRFEEK
ncbi:hypothetical protein [Promicromonospora sukumoe]|uniref:hypothetical protein n=1 Tax=Promicromonospora sukumoe TaxID=88382 RepID=UPI003648E2E9